MYKKKIIGIALIAAMVSSMSAVSVAADNANDSETTLEPSIYGIVGSMTEWGNGDIADFPMYETEEGVFVGSFDAVAGTELMFKVRANSAWQDADGNKTNWGVYEPDYDRTLDSQTNIVFTPEADAKITVKLDTTGDDDFVWPVSYKIGDGEWVYTGPEQAEEPTGEPSIYGIVGSMTGWADGSDFPMYETDKGITGF